MCSADSRHLQVPEGSFQIRPVAHALRYIDITRIYHVNKNAQFYYKWERNNRDGMHLPLAAARGDLSEQYNSKQLNTYNDYIHIWGIQDK